MSVRALLTILLLFLVNPVKAQEPIPETVLKSIKAATVFVRIKTDFNFGSGSGFLIHSDKDYGYIVTNRHVVDDSVFESLAIRKGELQVVFHSGLPEELALNAEILGMLHAEDLAILRVREPKKLPRPLDLETKQIPLETTTVYSFGFPFGKLLASSKGSPEITVGRATVSSLRRNDRRELKAIQLDGSLNPGNSGGPVTDAKGRVIGVVVSGVRGSNIGLAIPAAEVAAMLEGVPLGARFETTQIDDKETQVDVSARLLDPKSRLKQITFRYVREDVLGAKPDRQEVKALPQASSVDLSRSDATAKAKLKFPAADRGKTFWFQVGYQGADGVVRYSPAEYFRVTATGKVSLIPADLDRFKGSSIAVVYHPLKDSRARAEIEAKIRASVGNKAFLRLSLLGSQHRLEIYPVQDPRGLVERLDQEVGKVVRIDGSTVMLEVETPAEIAKIIALYEKFDALKMKPAHENGKLEHQPAAFGDAGAWKKLGLAVAKKEIKKSGVPVGNGGQEGPEDLLAEGGILIGMTVGKDRFIESIQPIYLTASGEKLGSRIGPQSKSSQTLKAEPGYAVGAINLRSGDLFDGITLVYMKMTKDGLDVNDAYRSTLVGNAGGEMVTVGGDGAYVLGIQSKTLRGAFIAPAGSITSLGVITSKK